MAFTCEDDNNRSAAHVRSEVPMSDDWQQPPPEAEPVLPPTAQAPPSWREPLLAGLAAALAGALAWALITVLTHYKVGLVAVGLGFLVGGVVRRFGGAGSQPHAVLSAILALLGCALGNLLSACALIAVERSVSKPEARSEEHTSE